MSAFSKTACAPMVALWIASLAPAPAAAPPAGDKIEFSSPNRLTQPATPPTERDFTRRAFNFQEETVDTSPGLMLPGYDYTARANAILQMIERSSALGLSLDGAEPMDIQDELSTDMLKTDLSLDELFVQADRERQRERERSRNNENLSPFADRDPVRRDGLNNQGMDGRFMSTAQQTSQDFNAQGVSSPFMHRLDIHGSNGEGLFSSRAPNDLGQLLNANAARALRENREREQREAREAGMEAFRAMLNQNFTTDSSSVPGGAATRPAIGAVPAPAAPAAGRSLSGLDDNFSPTTLPTDRLRGPTQIPSIRPGADFGLRPGFGTPATPGAFEPPAPTPLEMMQRKHDTRIPSRRF
jgi:hypothetical protein